jgi:hypothetical protein
MVSMKTQSDRTLFFDLLPLDLGEVMGFKTRFLLYTVPGQVFYNATRKLVLKGADAIVFVADSEKGKMEENLESLANLRTNLNEYGVRLDEIPWVLQYNKRDLPNVYTIEELNASLNPTGKVPFFEAVANQGKGVFETFRGVSSMLMDKVTRDLKKTAFSPSSRPRSESSTNPEPAAAAAPPAAVSPPTAVAPPANVVQAPGVEKPVLETPVAHAAQGRAPALPAEFGNEVALGGTATPAEAQEEPVQLRKPELRKATPAKRPEPVAAEIAMSRPKLHAEPSRGAPVLELDADRPGLKAEPVSSAPAPIEKPSNPSTEAVIPIQLPKGASREIVLRIVITEE